MTPPAKPTCGTCKYFLRGRRLDKLGKPASYGDCLHESRTFPIKHQDDTCPHHTTAPSAGRTDDEE